MAPVELLTTGEFDRRMTSLETMISRGFEQTDARLEDHGERIARLEAVNKKETRKSAAGWSSVVAGGVMAAFEIVKIALGK